MAKIVLPSIASGYNPATINNNFQLIASALNNNVLYRANISGEPNQMTGLLDMNGQRMLNLPKPVSSTEPVRLADIGDLGAAAAAEAQQYANAAAASAASSNLYAQQAASQVVAAQQQVVLASQEVTKAKGWSDQASVWNDSAAANAISSAISAASAAGFVTEAEQAVQDSLAYATSSSNSAATAQSIADQFAGGTVGFNAPAYDWGNVSDASTYFNRDFGTIV